MSTSEAAGPQVTGTDARVTLKWVADMAIAPGSVPDRVMEFSRARQSYRPDRVSLELSGSAASEGLRALCLTSPLMTGRVRDGITVLSVTISGPRLGRDGQLTKNRHEERLYLAADVPDWARELAAAALADLTSLAG